MGLEKNLLEYDYSSYNRSQVGNDKSLINQISEYLAKINVSISDIETIISTVGYYRKESINISLYMDLLCKSLGYLEEYSLDEILAIVKEIHDIYFPNSNHISFDDYLKDTKEERIIKLYLNSNNKYILKSFKDNTRLNYISELKFASAMCLKKKDYQDFNGSIDRYDTLQETYSTLSLLSTYVKMRQYLKEETRLFWDILFANEYIVSLNKHNIGLNQIYTKNIYKKSEVLNHNHNEQLDLFSYQSVKPESHNLDITTFQVCTIYNSNKIPNFEQEKDLIMYYKNLADTADMLEMAKLKSGYKKYVYNTEN